MARADYYLCDVCSQKCFYDSNIDWDAFTWLGDFAAICDECAKTHEIVVRPKQQKEANDGSD